LFYEYCSDILERRGPFREEHLALAWKAQARGELVLAGALTNPVDGAVFHFRGDSADAVVEFTKTDPYVRNGLVTRWHYREWATVVGDTASTPTGKPKGA